MVRLPPSFGKTVIFYQKRSMTEEQPTSNHCRFGPPISGPHPSSQQEHVARRRDVEIEYTACNAAHLTLTVLRHCCYKPGIVWFTRKEDG